MKLSWAFLWIKLVLISFLPVPRWQRASGVESKSPSPSGWTQACDAAGPCREKTPSHHCSGRGPASLCIHHRLPGSSSPSEVSASLAPISYSLHPSGSILTTPPLPVLRCIPCGTGPTSSMSPPGAHLPLVSSGSRPDSGRVIVTPALMLRDYSFRSAMFNGILNGIYEEPHRL